MHRVLSDVSAKRKAPGGMPARRRAKTSNVEQAKFELKNIVNGEVVHQSCVLLTGTAPAYDNSEADHIMIKSTDCFGATADVTSWPSGEAWRALVCLQPGTNTLTLDLRHLGSTTHSIKVEIVYQPLLQLPPLHLAIMVAKDSTLTMDCPASKFGAISSAHSSLNAAIEKLRTTAQMWQALTADQLQQCDLGRRAFRLEEEWTALGTSIIKVHIIRSEKTVEEVRALQSGGALRTAFLQALASYGGPFSSNAEPVVAGLVFDAHYSVEAGSILGYEHSGKHIPGGISVALYSSHATCTWPRSLSEVPAALMDTTPLDGTIGTGAGDRCHSLQDACSFSQAAFLWDVGQAFGLTDPVAVEFVDDWRHFFISAQQRTRDSTDRMWNMVNAYRLRSCRHFKAPGDVAWTRAFRNASIVFKPSFNHDDEEEFEVSCPDAHLVAVTITNGGKPVHHDLRDQTRGPTGVLTLTPLSTYSREAPLHIHVLASNGRTRTLENAWNYFADYAMLHVPKTEDSHSFDILKRGVRDETLEGLFSSDSDRTRKELNELVPWTVVFQKPSTAGTSIIAADRITTCVGATFDGVFVRYASGQTAHCGPEYTQGRRFPFGGNKSNCFISRSNYVTKVEIQKQYGSLDGIRITLSDGSVAGHLNNRCHWYDNAQYKEYATVVLEPGPGERIVGFYGRNARPHRGYTREFGILVANVDNLDKDGFLPRAVHDLTCVKTSGRWQGDGGPVEGSITAGAQEIDMMTEDEAEDSEWIGSDSEDEADEAEESSQPTLA